MKVTATGHRPQKVCEWSQYELALDRCTKLAGAFMDAQLRRHEIEEAISGMALLWDTAFALAAIDRAIPLTAAVPFEGQEKKWSKVDQARFNWILEKASKVVYVCEPGYAAWKMQKRNEFMVNEIEESGVIAALWDGSNGGTGNCIRYAESKGRTIVNLWNSWVKRSGIQPPGQIAERSIEPELTYENLSLL